MKKPIPIRKDNIAGYINNEVKDPPTAKRDKQTYINKRILNILKIIPIIAIIMIINLDLSLIFFNSRFLIFNSRFLILINNI